MSTLRGSTGSDAEEAGALEIPAAKAVSSP